MLLLCSRRSSAVVASGWLWLAGAPVGVGTAAVIKRCGCGRLVVNMLVSWSALAVSAEEICVEKWSGVFLLVSSVGDFNLFTLVMASGGRRSNLLIDLIIGR